MNVPDNLSAREDPANDFSDALTVLCDQVGCTNEVLVNTSELEVKFAATGGVTCHQCILDDIRS